MTATLPFSNSDDLFAALLEIAVEREFDPFDPHENIWVGAFQHRFGADEEGSGWEVLRISRSIDSFMVNIALTKLNEDFICFLRDLLSVTRPDDSVYVGVFDPVIEGDSILVGSLAVFKNEIWATGSIIPLI